MDHRHGHNVSRPPRGEPRQVRALVVPALPSLPCQLLVLANRSTDFSDAIGGVFLEETYPVTGDEQRQWCVYLSENRAGEPVNDRLCALAGALGWRTPSCEELRGPALVTGLQPSGDDADLSYATVRVAHRIGLLPEDPPARPAWW